MNLLRATRCGIAAWGRNAIYLGLLMVFLPWLVWQAVRTGKYREGWHQKLWGNVPIRRGGRPCVWFHAVSVGEVRLLQSVVSEFRRSQPDWDIVVSTTTITGKQIARQQFPDLVVFYCPLDFSWATRRVVKRVRPSLVVFAELEIWPNLIQQIKSAGARLVLINGRLSDNSFRGYRRVKLLMRSTFASFDGVIAQSEQYAERFRALGCAGHSVRAVGSIKFDGACTDRHNELTTRLGADVGLSDGDKVFLAGSTQANEEEIALSVFGELANRWPELRLILVPRHPERFDEVAKLIEDSPHATCRRSRPTDRWRVMLVDTIGELGGWWGHADIAYVGGSMGSRGGQNMIEPAAYGAAVCFGPRTENFRDVVRMMLQADAAQVVHDREELARFVESCLTDQDAAQAQGKRAQQLVIGQQGALERTMEGLLEHLSDSEHHRGTQADRAA